MPVYDPFWYPFIAVQYNSHWPERERGRDYIFGHDIFLFLLHPECRLFSRNSLPRRQAISRLAVALHARFRPGHNRERISNKRERRLGFNSLYESPPLPSPFDPTLRHSRTWLASVYCISSGRRRPRVPCIYLSPR